MIRKIRYSSNQDTEMSDNFGNILELSNLISLDKIY